MSFIVQCSTKAKTLPEISLRGIIGKDGHVYWILKDALQLLGDEDTINRARMLSNVRVTDAMYLNPHINPCHRKQPTIPESALPSREFLQHHVITHLQMCKLLEKSKWQCVRKFAKQLNHPETRVQCVETQDPGQMQTPSLLKLLNKPAKNRIPSILNPHQMRTFLLQPATTNSTATFFFTWVACFKEQVMAKLYENQDIMFVEFFQKEFPFPQKLRVRRGEKEMDYVLTEQ